MDAVNSFWQNLFMAKFFHFKVKKTRFFSLWQIANFFPNIYAIRIMFQENKISKFLIDSGHSSNG